MKYANCPKCGTPNTGAPDQCGDCGIVYAKWFRSQLRRETPVPSGSRGGTELSIAGRLSGLMQSERWLHVEERVNVFEFGGRSIGLAIMAVWGVLLIQTNPRVTTGLFPELSFYDPFISAFMLAFHEAGHVIFSFLGRFMAVAGGTLMQWLVPGSLMLAFVYKYRNPFAGAVALWLLGYSVIDAGPYCYDARDMQLMLVGGGTGREIGGHDWNNLLRWTGLLEQHERIALLFDTVGELLIITAVAWDGWLLKLQFARLDRR